MKYCGAFTGAIVIGVVPTCTLPFGHHGLHSAGYTPPKLVTLTEVLAQTRRARVIFVGGGGTWWEVDALRRSPIKFSLEEATEPVWEIEPEPVIPQDAPPWTYNEQINGFKDAAGRLVTWDVETCKMVVKAVNAYAARTCACHGYL